ncbi:MAG: hypothetical protein CGW95_09775 [Phenylobacterium zucineum]|nr:MAG: hypothetical protein CGW95_09775 [Phenylobacterium zucineum]
MNPFERTAAELLQSARDRGSQVLENVVLPSGLDHFTVYSGLIGNAIELAKLIRTEERDLKVIESHYQLAKANLEAAFAEVERAMQVDFERDESLKTKTFEAINQLIAAGQFDIASEFHKRLIDGFNRSSLDAILAHRNAVASGSGSRLYTR